jgi:hypothetical protein
MASRTYGYALRAAVLVCLTSAIYCFAVSRPYAYWKLDPNEYAPWRTPIWLLAAFLAWCASRYSFNRAADRPANRLDRVLFSGAWILVVVAVLGLVARVIDAFANLRD